MSDSKITMAEARASDPVDGVAIPDHVHIWEACRVGMNVTDYQMCVICEEVEAVTDLPSAGQLVPEVINGINREARRQADAAPYLRQYQQGLVTVEELAEALVRIVTGVSS